MAGWSCVSIRSAEVRSELTNSYTACVQQVSTFEILEIVLYLCILEIKIFCAQGAGEIVECFDVAGILSE